MLELPAVGGGEDAAPGQIADILHPVEILGDPEQRLQVPEAAFAVLNVRLEHVAGVAHPLVSGIAFGELGLDEGGAGHRHQLGHEPLFEGMEQRSVPPQPARFQEAGANRQVVLGQAHAIVDRAGGVADLQARIPQHVEDVLDDLLGKRRRLRRQQKHQVDVGEGRQLAAAVAAGGDHRLLATAGGVAGIDVCRREVVDGADELVDEERVRLHHFGSARALFLEPSAHLADAPVQGGLEYLQGIGATARRW